MSIDTQAAFDLMLQVFTVTAPIGLVWAILSRVFRSFIDMVTGRDSIRL